ncbi:hypothetical protein TELCIR_08236 [Teladorsagia circumcincta]|uniref:Uncharacterized protein n=1 Tax=Teladorsagia circumcincta TaxID=45464 RepID=A0A2G9UI58_TELCI|nr:hypothetical protein TELCIR_08236 [Teladorsagia circumcincta]
MRGLHIEIAGRLLQTQDPKRRSKLELQLRSFCGDHVFRSC